MDFREYFDRFSNAVSELNQDQMYGLLLDMALIIEEDVWEDVVAEAEALQSERSSDDSKVQENLDIDLDLGDEPKAAEDLILFEESVRNCIEEWTSISDKDRWIQAEKNKDYSRWKDPEDSEYIYSDPNHIIDKAEILLKTASQAADDGSWKLAYEMIRTMTETSVNIEGSYPEDWLSFLQEIVWSEYDLLSEAADSTLDAAASDFAIDDREKARVLLDLIPYSMVGYYTLSDAIKNNESRFSQEFLTEWMKQVSLSENIEPSLKYRLYFLAFRRLADIDGFEELVLETAEALPAVLYRYYEEKEQEWITNHKIEFLKKAVERAQNDPDVQAKLLDKYSRIRFEEGLNDTASRKQLEAFRLSPSVRRYFLTVYFNPEISFPSDLEIKGSSKLFDCIDFVEALEGDMHSLLIDLSLPCFNLDAVLGCVLGILAEGNLENQALVLLGKRVLYSSFEDSESEDSVQEPDVFSILESVFRRAAKIYSFSKRQKQGTLETVERSLKSYVNQALTNNESQDLIESVQMIDAYGYVKEVCGDQDAYSNLRKTFLEERSQNHAFRDEFDALIRLA